MDQVVNSPLVGLAPQTFLFNPSPIHVGFVANEWAVVQVRLCIHFDFTLSPTLPANPFTTDAT
jgi:hypothetical protein